MRSVPGGSPDVWSLSVPATRNFSGRAVIRCRAGDA